MQTFPDVLRSEFVAGYEGTAPIMGRTKDAVRQLAVRRVLDFEPVCRIGPWKIFRREDVERSGLRKTK